MIFRRLSLALAAAACLATAASIVVVALAFALYAVLREPFGPAAAAGGVALAAALFMLIFGVVLAQAARVGAGRRSRGRGGLDSARLVDAVEDLVRDRPIAAAALAAAAGWLFTRAPGLASALGEIISGRGRGRRD